MQRLRRTTENDRIELEVLRRSHASAASRRAAVEARLESEVAAKRLAAERLAAEAEAEATAEAERLAAEAEARRLAAERTSPLKSTVCGLSCLAPLFTLVSSLSCSPFSR